MLTPRRFDGRRERHGLRDTPPSEIVLDGDSSLTLPQIKSSQLSLIASRSASICCRARGAEWRCVDFELGRGAGGAE
jgi:hypothetical protein